MTIPVVTQTYLSPKMNGEEVANIIVIWTRIRAHAPVETVINNGKMLRPLLNTI